MKYVLSTAINAGVVASMIAIGITGVDELRAEQRLEAITNEDMNCLQQNIYWEARNQESLGQVAVAWLTINRVESTKYPNSICAVVKQGHKNAAGGMKRHKCQFSWYCDGKSDVVPNNVVEQRAWHEAGMIATAVTIAWAYDDQEQNPIQDSVMYHADYVDPYWKSAYAEVTTIGKHIFYKEN